MANEAIKNIMLAEARAEEAVSAAKLRAKELCDEAKRRGEALLADAEGKALELSKANAKKSVELAVKEKTGAEEKISAECEKLVVLANGRMDKAAACILERIVKG